MLTIESLNQYYGGSHILRDVSLTAETGRLTVLLGATASARRRSCAA